MANPSIYLEIDASNLNEEIIKLKTVMKPERFERAMYGIFQRTGKHVKKILRADLPREYNIQPKLINSAVKSAKMTSGAGGIGCSIPIRDTRGSIGGRYSASGGANGWNNVKYGRKYRVKAKVVKKHMSTLPKNMENQGGYPPFRNLSFSNVTFTRTGRKTKKGKDAIAKVVGIAIPQMPMNRSQEGVQRDILNYMKKEIEHRFNAVIKYGK